MKNHSPKAIAVLLFFYLQMQTLYSYSKPMNCTDTSRLCTSFIAFKPSPNETLPILQSMFDVLPGDITAENGDLNYVFIKKNCACLYPYRMYLTNTTYTMRASGGYVHEMVRGAYQGLAFLPNSTRIARARAVISLKLFCGCSSGLWNYLMSYVMGEEDTVESLASRFGVSMDSIESINGIQDPNIITVGQNYYIPLNSVPGSPYPVETDISPAPVPALVSNNYSDQVDHKRNVPYGWIVGSLGFGFGLIVIAALICVMLRCFGEAQGNKKDPDGKNTHKFYVLHNTSFCCKPGDEKHTNGESSDRHINYPKAFGATVFNMDKPAVLTYEDLLFATDNFSETNLLGHGRYGSVYYGLLYDQEVAIKRMTATKSEAFMSEMKVLCKVHHANLVELIGYAASGDELFLIYENAQKGSLRSHLHGPQSKGYPPLSWIMRVQIALDAARGLEYIHEHAKINYIHRDIKTNNILLDGAFRAKISDFGLAKLVGKASDGEVKATRVVGTFGYLAPEYLSDGLATTKSDVYAFGVVLFEIISGREAAIQTRDMVTKSYERRSLASIMLRALRNSPDSMKMSRLKDYIDPNLLDLYPHDCLYKLAMLAKQCVDDDPILRPDMKQVVISLSQILLSSVEWEATLAGNSEIFSGIVQGR